MNDTYKTFHWHDKQNTRVTITADDTSALLEVLYPSEEDIELELEVLQVSRDRDGIPVGNPFAVFRATLLARSLPTGNRSIGRIWLPKHLTEMVLERCYIKVQTNGGSTALGQRKRQSEND